MDDVSFSKKANISVINRFDPQVKDIVISASQVALYVFDAPSSKWIKRKVEGACFIYKRKTIPKYGIFILNRLDTNNFIEHMTSTMEIQLQEPYILYRNAFKTVYGVWFYEKTECIATASIFQRILTELKEKEKGDHEDTLRDKNRVIEPTDLNGHDSHSKTPNGPPDSVRQFFAKASKEATKPLPISAGGNRCTPFQSVSLIEKAHQSDQSPFTVTGNLVKPKTGFLSGMLKESSVIPERTVLYPTKSDSTSSMWKESSVIPDRMVLCPILEPDMLKSEEYKASVQMIENNIRSMNLSSAANYEKFPSGLPIEKCSGTCSELPELIPPGMLLTPDLSSSYKTDPVSDPGIMLKKNVLTKTQMIQAMEYLLKNDSQFTDKLYDAYLKSSRIN